MGINSCLYEMTISHARHQPMHYHFQHRVFMFYLDLAELSQLSQVSALVGHHQKRLYEFRDTDHIDVGAGDINANIRLYLKRHGIEDKVKRICLLTNLRSFGYIFNPVSFYFCFGADGHPVCVVPEIGNTFKELKYFYLGPDRRQENIFKGQQTKFYYISPFTDLDDDLEFRIEVPDERLQISIDVSRRGKKYFFSSMEGVRVPLTTGRLLLETVRFPFVTVKVIALIHWHAAVLFFFKRLRHHPKEENQDMQREIHREWRKT